MNWKECGLKHSWPNSRYHPGICQEGQRKCKESLQNTKQWR